jgi:S1-C subfamily serine protease
VKLAVLRGDSEFLLLVTPIEVRSEFDSAAAMADPEKSLVPELGFVGVEIDARIAAIATGLRDPFGIMVVARAAGTVDAPIQARDIIRTVNNQRVTTLPALRDTIRALPPGSPVTLQIQRGAKLMFVAFTLE